MGKRLRTGGAFGVGRCRIRFDFIFDGRRYRPSVLIAPTEANLRRARERLGHIKERIAAGTFSFVDEFPNFRDLDCVPSIGHAERAIKSSTHSSFIANPAWPKRTLHRLR